jgi:tripartite-type tricarboxylate transporter receptor subunit TctC
MKLCRRQFLELAAGAAFAGAPHSARAQVYPTRPVRWVIGFQAGGLADLIARPMAQWLSGRLGQPIILENRPGAAGNIATEMVAHAPADGHTLLWVNPANATSATFYEKLSFNFLRDIAAVASIIRLPIVIAVNPSVPARTIPELIAYAKANPGKLSYASTGNGSTNHLSGELFKIVTGINMVHVPYRGSAPALMDLIAGQVQVIFDNLVTSLEYARTGKLRALAVTTAMRSPALPDVPSVSEFVLGLEVSIWQGVGVPKKTSSEIIERLNSEINAALADSEIKARFADLGATTFPGSPADFSNFIAGETEKWGKVIREANVKVD